MSTPTATAPRAGFNPVAWLLIILPASAVVGSVASAVLAVRDGDPPLPERFHWEGAQLDADQARLAAAAAQGITARLDVDVAAHACRLTLTGTAPAAVRVELAHATFAGMDQHLLLTRNGDAYSGACTLPAAGHWWLDVSDASGRWLVRQRLML